MLEVNFGNTILDNSDTILDNSKWEKITEGILKKSISGTERERLSLRGKKINVD